MSKRNRTIEPEPQATTAAVLDPPESGPPSAEELGGEMPVEPIEDDHPAMPTPADPSELAVAAQLPAKFVGGPDCSTIVANLDRPSAPVWPADSPFKVDWPWAGEPDPVPGDIVGWNWERREIAVVTTVPPATQPWPYTLTVAILPMPEEWHVVKIFDLNSGQRIDAFWYTRWNRAYVDASGNDVPVVGSGWLAVVQQKAGQ